ncbi:nuclear transport factor 2 family protein [Nocardioides mangrovi]|uniref:Nuclear transport factor 2 family protein n=1 Tax=Nocardioides mangrovi TaxID=2874580 RepID=A0ABS7UI70_9ACTN|nr:nuclear transport factor 2 family protein [Nocardioides mangrovi]MBZ5740495.1 nuclear transport factor 2 family protein [Nocardioides mangrovi]
MTEVPDAVATQVLRAYARQSRLIDTGDASGWAATFTADGEFHSPSYPAPAVGAEALRDFAAAFARTALETGVVSRHVVTNVDVLPGADVDHVVAHAYLQIVATPTGGESRLVRLTTLTDQLVRRDGRWLVAHREVRRDDAGLPVTTGTGTHA